MFRSDEKTADSVFVTGVYVLERLPGSDDVFRRIHAHGPEDRDSPWWRCVSSSFDRDFSTNYHFSLL